MNNFGYNTVYLTDWKIMHFVLLTFRDNLFADSQSVIFIIPHSTNTHQQDSINITK